jgi:hypothetical protein
MSNLDFEVLDYPININGVSYKNTLSEDLTIDKTDLDQEFMEHAREHAYYGTLAEIAQSNAERWKYRLEVLYASIDSEKRMEGMEAQSHNPKLKFTESVYENLVKSDKRYQEGMKEYLDAKELAGKLSAAAKAFDKRTETLRKFDRIESQMMKDLTVKASQITKRGI